MTFSEYKQMVPKDLALDKANLDHESQRTAQIHNKYLIFYLEETSKYEAMKRAFNSLKHKQTLYYLGKADPDVYKEKPFDLRVKPIKSEVEQFLSADVDMQAAEAALIEQANVVKYLNDTLKMINQRSYDIKSMIEWIKFKHGLNT